MLQFLPQLYLDFASFWLGFLAGAVFVVLFRRFQPEISRFWKKLVQTIMSISDRAFSSSGEELRQRTYEFCQGLHLASPLCPLEDLIITPRFLAPPPVDQPGKETPDPTILQQTLPYLPDYPEMAAEYQSPSFTLEEAAAAGVDLLILGKSGAGKTTAAAHFISRLASRKLRSPELNQCFPLWVEAADLLPGLPAAHPTQAISSAVHANRRLALTGSAGDTVSSALEAGKVFLVIDGTDLLPAPQISVIADFIELIRKTYPDIQLITTAIPEAVDGFLGSGLYPISLAGWGKQEKAQFVRRWGECWSHYDNPRPLDKTLPDHYFLNSWLSFQLEQASPLEYTLKVWGAYAGDLLGPGIREAIASHLKRTAAALPHSDLVTLQITAYAALLEGAASFSKQTILRWTKKSDLGSLIEFEDSKSNPLGQLLFTAQENQILVRHRSDRFSFSHPSLAGYLAGRAIAQLKEVNLQPLFNQTPWALREETLRHLDLSEINSSSFQAFLEKQDPTARNLQAAGRWLSTLNPDDPFRQLILKHFARAIQKNPILEVKLRLVTTLINSGDPQAPVLLRHLIKIEDPEIQQAACLGSGYARDHKAVPLLIDSLHAPPPVSYAACFGLVNIGTPPALEAVADVLLSADEMLRRAAASALANHPEEGHPALQDGSSMDDLMIRYAVVYGLKRINKRWAVEILDRMRIEESEWIVRDAAQNSYEDLLSPPPSLPEPEPPLEDTPWLIAFAGEQGLGLSASSPETKQVLLEVLQEGSIAQQAAALYLIRREGITDVFPDLYNSLNSGNPQVRAQAALTLWFIAASGADLPSPPYAG